MSEPLPTSPLDVLVAAGVAHRSTASVPAVHYASRLPVLPRRCRYCCCCRRPPPLAACTAASCDLMACTNCGAVGRSRGSAHQHASASSLHGATQSWGVSGRSRSTRVSQGCQAAPCAPQLSVNGADSRWQRHTTQRATRKAPVVCLLPRGKLARQQQDRRSRSRSGRAS